MVNHVVEAAEGVHRLTNGVSNFCTWRVGPQIMPSGLNADTPRALASLAHLDGIKADVLLPGHGQSWTGGVQEAIRRARSAGAS